ICFNVVENNNLGSYHSLILMSLLLLRNLSLGSSITVYNLLILKLDDSALREKISFHNKFSSHIIRDFFTIFGCLCYSYFIEQFGSIFIVLYVIPLGLNIWGFVIGKYFLLS